MPGKKAQERAADAPRPREPPATAKARRRARRSRRCSPRGAAVRGRMRARNPPSPLSSQEASRSETRCQPVLLGEFGRAHGLRGEVRLKSFTADPLAIASYGPLIAEAGAASARSTSAGSRRRARSADRAGRGRRRPRRRPRRSTGCALYRRRATGCRRRTKTSSCSPTWSALPCTMRHGAVLGTVVGRAELWRRRSSRNQAGAGRRDRAAALHPGLRAGGRPRGRRVVVDAPGDLFAAAKPPPDAAEDERDLRGHDPHPLSRRCFPARSGISLVRRGARIAASGRSRRATSATTGSAATAPSTIRRPAAGPAW